MIKKDRAATDDAFAVNDKVFINDNSTKVDENIEKADIDDLNQMRNSGQDVLFAAACLILTTIGLPVILIYFFKSPLPDQHLFIFGISYFKLVLISFICSAIMAYLSFFFIRTRPTIIIPVFLFALFCCFPFIVGLKGGLTLKETMLNQALFSSWPFFLKPTYLFFELLIPTGIVIYSFLQLKNSIGKKKHSYAYLFIAAFLGITAFIGLSTLRQTGQPSLISFVMPQIKNMIVSSSSFIKNSLPGSDLKTPGSIPIQKIGAPIEKQPEIDESQKTSNQASTYPNLLTLETATETGVSPPAQDQVWDADLKVSTTLEQDLQKLRIQSDHILDLLSKIEITLANKTDGMEKSSAKAEFQPLTELQSILNRTSTLNTREGTQIDIKKELQDLSKRLDLVLKSISPDVKSTTQNELIKEKAIENEPASGEKTGKI